MKPTPETTLLLASARRVMDATTNAAAHAALRDGIDWDIFLSLAKQHGLTPLVQHHVTAGAIPSAAIPTPVLANLQSEATSIARRSLYLSGELAAILRDFAAQEIPCVPLKGPVLAQSVYGDVALRRMNDLDVLVHEHDLARAMTRLSDRGYTGVAMPSARERQVSHHVSMFVASGVHRVELHYHVLHPGCRQPYHLSDIADGLRSATFQGVPVQVLSDELLLTYLCIHGAEHLWERLEWLCSVTELVRSGRVSDWGLVDAYAKQFDDERRVHTALVIAHQLLGAPVPNAGPGTGGHVSATAGFVVRRYIVSPGSLFGSVRRYWYRLRLDVNHRARLKRSWTTFCRHQAEGRAAHHPRLLWILYSVVRPVWLYSRYWAKRTMDE